LGVGSNRGDSKTERDKTEAALLPGDLGYVVRAGAGGRGYAENDRQPQTQTTRYRGDHFSPGMDFCGWCKKNRVEHNKLQEELEQLGTPREHASVLSRIYRDSRDQLAVFLQNKSLRLSTLESCEVTVLHEQQNKAFVLDISIKSANTVTNRKVVMNGTNFSVLKQELELAVEKMEQYLQ